MVVAIFLSVSLGSNAVLAACSPGIPCTGYDIYTNPNSGTDATFSGAKTGVPSPHANVTGTTTSACDGNFMNQIYSRAFLEGSREVIMSEQLIHKPDSVLEYTCFDKFINMAAHNAGAAFSESQKWQSVEIDLWTRDDTSTTTTINDTGATSGFPDQSEYSVFSGDRLDNVLTGFLFDILQDYIDDNFDHSFLGESLTINNDIDTSGIGSNSYLCTHMETVWNIARCIDFGEDDRFRSFEHLVNFDPRSIPQSCSPSNESSDAIEAGSDPTKYENISSGGGILNKMPIDLKVSAITDPITGLTADIDLDGAGKCPPVGDVVSGVNTDFSNDIIRVANNCDHETDDDKLNMYSSFDVMRTYTDMIKGFGLYIPGVSELDLSGETSGTITPNVMCSSPLPTGVPVITYNITNSLSGNVDTMQRSYQFHFDHICPNAGCYYQPVKVPYIWGAPIPAVGIGICLPIL